MVIGEHVVEEAGEVARRVKVGGAVDEEVHGGAMVGKEEGGLPLKGDELGRLTFETVSRKGARTKNWIRGLRCWRAFSISHCTKPGVGVARIMAGMSPSGVHVAERL